MAAGEIYVKTGSTALFWRDANNVERSKIGNLTGANRLVGTLSIGQFTNRLEYQPGSGAHRDITGSLISTGNSPAGLLYINIQYGQLRWIAPNGGLYYIQ